MKKRKILVIDDDFTNLFLLKSILQKMDFQAICTQSASEGLNIAVEQKPDMILLDIVMPDVDGFEVCKILKTNKDTSMIPVIFISGKNDSYDKIKGLKMGAIDYVTKPFDVGELKARIGVVLKIIELQEKNSELANTDDLTGLFNRRYFFNLLDRHLSTAKNNDDFVALLMLDIDYFKAINDQFGHLAGDDILRQMGKLLNENLYLSDIAARYGGEEFIILMPGADCDRALVAAQRLRQIIEEYPWNANGNEISVTVSIGLKSSAIREVTDIKELLKEADEALYLAKQNGRNCVVCQDHIDQAAETSII